MPFFNHNGANLFYTTHGPLTSSTPPILLLHGWACDSHDFTFQIPFLTSLNLRVIAFDHRGHGRSSNPSDLEAYSMHTLANDVVALLAHLRVGPVVVIAHSMSTIVASLLAVEKPEIVEALVLLHPIYCGTPPALAAMGTTMKEDLEGAPGLAADFFSNFMYTSRTPQWLKTWHIRRVLGTDPAALSGCVQGIVNLFGSVIGQREEAVKFMRMRKGPRLVVCTNGLPAAEGWERELGIEEGIDKIYVMNEGTFSHAVESETFNEVLEAWLKERRLC